MLRAQSSYYCVVVVVDTLPQAFFHHVSCQHGLCVIDLPQGGRVHCTHEPAEASYDHGRAVFSSLVVVIITLRIQCEQYLD